MEIDSVQRATASRAACDADVSGTVAMRRASAVWDFVDLCLSQPHTLRRPLRQLRARKRKHRLQTGLIVLKPKFTTMEPRNGGRKT